MTDGTARTMALAVLLTALMPIRVVTAADSPLTSLVVPDQGGRPFVPGETPPPADRRVPVVRAVVAPPPPTVPEPPPALVVAPTPPPPPPRAPQPWHPKHVFQLEVGPLLLPDSVFSYLSRFDKHPQLRGVAIDLSYWRPIVRDRWLAFRLGVGLPDVPAANWYESARTPANDPSDTRARALYTKVGIVAIDAAVDYVGHTPLLATLDWTWRAGIGLVVLPGDVENIETLPSCTAAERPVCPHWRTVGRANASMPVVLPMLRATTGLSWRLSDRTAIGLEAGLRDVLWLGASAAVSY